MENRLTKLMNNFYYDIAISELRMLHTIEKQEGITYNDMLYLNIIHAHPGKFSSSQIADMLFVSRPSVTQKINELEKKGYVTKVRDAKDKRIYHLYISEENGYSDFMRKLSKQDQEVLRKLLVKYGESELDKFLGFIEEITELYYSVGEEMEEKVIKGENDGR